MAPLPLTRPYFQYSPGFSGSPDSPDSPGFPGSPGSPGFHRSYTLVSPGFPLVI